VDDGDLYTLNLDAHYDLQTTRSYSFWLGGVGKVSAGVKRFPDMRRYRYG
jgi:hypothetical protein